MCTCVLSDLNDSFLFECIEMCKLDGKGSGRTWICSSCLFWLLVGSFITSAVAAYVVAKSTQTHFRMGCVMEEHSSSLLEEHSFTWSSTCIVYWERWHLVLLGQLQHQSANCLESVVLGHLRNSVIVGISRKMLIIRKNVNIEKKGGNLW